MTGPVCPNGCDARLGQVDESVDGRIVWFICGRCGRRFPHTRGWAEREREAGR